MNQQNIRLLRIDYLGKANSVVGLPSTIFAAEIQRLSMRK